MLDPILCEIVKNALLMVAQEAGIRSARSAGSTFVSQSAEVACALFDADGRVKRDHLVPYVEEVRKIAQEKKVFLIDLYAMTLAQAEALPASERESLNAVTKEGKTDTTHLGPKGRREIGAMAADQFYTVVWGVKP